jgi:hypothetical protein
MDQMSNEQNGSFGAGTSRPLASVLAIAACVLRLIPHPWNFTPVGALGLFAGGRLRSWHAFVLPVGVMLASDVVLGFLRGREYLFHPLTAVVYGCFLLNVLLGRLLCRAESPWRIGSVSLLASVLFFLITNFAQWAILGVNPESAEALQPGQYPYTFAGLLACYAAAVPFFQYTLLGDLAYSAILFGTHAWLAQMRFPAERVRVPAPK